jgi:hypothetical protein
VDDTLRNLFPEIYHARLPSFFDNARPREEKATCDSCTMCPPKDAGAPSDDVTYFRPDTKCCTYHPRIPNYLVGGLLADPSPEMREGRRRMQERIKNRISITPRWVAPPRKNETLLRASWKNTMGRSLLLRCPFYGAESGSCTVWRYREIECTTFFCKYMAGADGERFWKTLRAYMVHVEARLAEHALRALYPDYADPADEGMTLEELEDRPPAPQTYAAIWRAFEGREEEFYMACHEHIASLDRATFEAVVRGETHEQRLGELEDAHRVMTKPTLPERLVPNPAMAARPVDGGVLVKTYSRYEPLLLNEALYEVTQAFGSGETVSAIRERLSREAGVEIPDELLISLHQLRVLVPPPGEGKPT